MSSAELAPAKVNLTLHVTGQRADGYHLLDSLVVFTELGDTVSARPGRGLSLSIKGPEAAGLSAGPDNLVWRAARLTGAEDVALLLTKRLPRASGIGGGSSDAAAALRLIARMTGAVLPDPSATLALGADVPVCLAPGPQRLQGVGEVVTPLPACPELWLVLVNPRIEVATPQVFAKLAHRDNPPMPDALPHWPDAVALCDWLAEQRNDLQAPACAMVPEIGRVIDALAGTTGCALARMSGSGATCFGLYAQRKTAEAAATALRADHPRWWIRATKTLSQ